MTRARPTLYGARPMEIGSADRYVAVIFTSQRTGVGDDEYAVTAERMRALAAQQPGYLGFENAVSPDGVGISVSYWATDADARNWKQHSEHLLAQQAGRERWYQWYRLRVATVEREYSYDRDA